MKHRCKLGLVPAILTLLCCSGPVRAGDQVPFKGTFTGVAIPTVVDPCTISVPISGAGQATHLGRFTWASTSIATEICTLFPSFNIHETVTLTAANGDQLFGTGVGTGTTVDFTDPSKIQVTVEETITITGGTGRFAHSTGTIHVILLSKVYERTFLPDGTALDPIVVTLEGTLSSVGSNKK